MVRIVKIQMQGKIGLIDVAAVAQDDDGNIAISGGDQTIVRSLEHAKEVGIRHNGTVYKDESFMEGILIKYNRPPYVYAKEV